MPTIFTFEVKDEAEIRDDILRTLRSGLIALGVPDPNVSPDSDYYVLATALGRELSVAHANAAVQVDNILPDTADFDALVRWGQSIGLAPKGATVSLGALVFSASQLSAVTLGAQLLDGQGLKYAVTVGGSYNDGDLVAIASVDTGPKTELASGATLRWLTAPPYASQTAVVSSPGLKGGTDAEGLEAWRGRVVARLANPPSAGNAEHVAELAENSAPSVEKGFVYPALQGPATVHFAVTAAATSKNRNRDVPSTIVNTVVVPTVQGVLPEHALVVGTTVTNQPTTVAIGLALPASGAASPPGPGGGWLDGTPWPPSFCDVEVTPTSSTTFVVLNPGTYPTPGVSRVAWVSWDGDSPWTLYTATVQSFVDVGGGNLQITIDQPFPGIHKDDLIFPQSARQDAYLAALLDAFAAMGPGEKTANATVLTRAFRHPLPSLSWTYSLNAVQLRALEDAGSEVLVASWLYRSIITPLVPASVTDPPSILVPRAIGFYPTS
jgi:uncharacterized phage protein gp47/JayE